MNRRKTSKGFTALLLVLVLWATHTPPVAAQACAPNICCATNPTTGAPACGAAAGNPLNVMSGNKFQREEDMAALPGVLGLELVRYYNSEASIADHRGILGRGWRLSYEVELVVRPGGNIITLHQGDGTQIRYVKSLVQPEADTTLYNSNQAVGSSLHAKRAASGSTQGTEYILGPAGQGNGNRQTFDAQGKLVQITAPTGEFVSLQRDVAGFLLRVTDPQGRFLTLRHLPPPEVRAGNKYRGIQHIDSPVGRFGYEYGSLAPQGSTAEPRELMANLVKVSLPTHYDPDTPANAAGGSADRGVSTSSVSKRYHYEDARRPNLITGISVQGKGSDGKLMDQRLVTWGYDARGRANLSVKGSYDPAKAGAEQVTLEFHHKASDGSGITVLTNSLGQTTRYSYAQINGQPQLLEVRGAGCATCGLVNVQYRYDSRGRQTHQLKLDPSGQAIAGHLTEYDGVDRPIRLSALSYRNGKAGPPQLQVRREYGADPTNLHPVLIARPSVIAGKEHITRIEYNEKGQPLSVTEHGFSPIDESGQPASRGTPISRTIRYSYEVVNNRSVLAQIDGPLPNGPTNSPADSDVTRVAWDKAGSFITAIEEPGPRRSSVQYNNTGRIAQVQNAQGASTRFDYTTSGALQRISSTTPGWKEPRVQVFRHDALGRVTEGGEQPGGDASYRARFAQDFDIAGRLQWRASSLGILEQHGYDSESRLVQSGRYTNSMAQSLSYELDEQGRLRSMRDKSGAAYQFSYSAQGGIARVRDQLGDLWAASSDRARRRVTAAKSRQLVDDFGRVVGIIDADSGRTVREYDSADQMVSSRDAMGNRARYEYDLQGRIHRQTITNVQNGQDSQTRWHYARGHLVWLEHPDQHERYVHDARGLRTSKTVTLKTPDGERSSTTHYDYDAQGILQASSLPDGSRIEYQRNGQGQVVALHRQRVRTPWLRWAVADQVIVKDLQRDLVAIKSYVTGNGIAAQLQRSNTGVLARMVYRNTRQPRLQTAQLNLPGLGTAHAGTPQPTPVNHTAPGATGQPADRQALVDHRYLWDTRGNLLLGQDSKEKSVQAQTYAYDLHDRLLASATDGEFNRYAYDTLGRRVLAQQGMKDQSSMNGTVKIGYAPGGAFRWVSARDALHHSQAKYDASGLPQKIGQRAYTWDALGRLLQIKGGDKVLAAYRYNHRGERISKTVAEGNTAYLYEDKQLTAELDAKGRITRQYLYLADAPIAAIDTPQGLPLAGEDWQGTLLRDLRMIAAAAFTTDNSLVWLHPNHLGAPEAATDANARVVWQASYAPFGQVHVKSENFTLNIRLPGQYEDAESGLYYNRQRYYDPQQGQYLTPDPLGTPDGPNGYAYVKYNPLKYVDPDGLVLFAFDGTGNDESNANTRSNVVKFRDLYDDGTPYYITGPGTKDPQTGIVNPLYKGGNPGDVIDTFTGKERIAAMIDYLDQYSGTVDDETAFDIDVVGFSRGSAQARDFANQLVGSYENGYYRYTDTQSNTHCQKVNFRFMGLFDTVLSKHVGSYRLRIPDAFEYVAQAVALNEYRGNLVKFPLESIMGVPASNDRTRIERGFLGSHSDIGGSFPDGDLAKVALVWMVDQAKAAGVKIGNPESTIIPSPVVHDKSTNLLGGAPEGGPTATSEDRDVRFMDGTTANQRQANISGMRWADTTQFITYKSDPNQNDNISGTVDMKAYLQWLNQHDYSINMTVQ